MKDQLHCVLDFESYSEAELKKVGSYEYAVHPSTEVICVAWKVGTRETLMEAKTKVWSPLRPTMDIQELLSVFQNSNIILTAHNAGFEQVITKFVLSRHCRTQEYLKRIPVDRWLCTASLAAAIAIPRKLELAAKILKLKHQKDMEGNRLMLKWAKPRKPTKNNLSTRHTDPEELDRIIDYCVRDIDVEAELFLKCPPLTDKERQVWLLDQKINLNGFMVDRPLVNTILGMIDSEVKRANELTRSMTYGVLTSASQRDAVLETLRSYGLDLPDLQKQTVEETLKREDVYGEARELLELRQVMAKTSTAKYEAFEKRSRYDGRLRDILVYHAASPGRWGGAGVQPQNLPRPTIKNVDEVIEDIKAGDIEWVRAIHGNPSNAFSNCIRGMIIAPPGKTLDVADYAAIEARVAFWLADHEAGLKSFRDGVDLYKQQAGNIYNRPADTILNGSFERFLGKTAVLGAIYGMGAPKFVETCANQGQTVSLDLAKRAVQSFRTLHEPIAELWDKYTRVTIAAVENPKKRFTINHTTWYVDGRFLFCILPSGRRLAYPDPEVRYEMVFGNKRPVLYYWGVDGYTKKWAAQKNWGGGILENVSQAVARDLMAEAMLRIDATGDWDIVLSVHDELVAERRLNSAVDNKDFCNLMAEVPDWAKGMPIAVEGFECLRYRK